jgi:uncharacterized protein
VKIVDANVLLYAVNADAPHHEPSRRWLDDALGGGDTVGFSWVVLLAFIRLSTNPAVFTEPLDSDTGISIVRGWLGSPRAVIAEPTARHIDVLAGLLVDAGTAANLVNDAHLAALALEHGAELVTYDADFGRFSGVRWKRPIELLDP